MFETLRRVVTSADATLKLRCEACGHRAEWTREQAFTVFGPDAAPYDIRHRLKCNSCGERGGVSVSI
jgi:hypothetical protein